MNKKISLGLAISLIIVSITASFAITMAVSKRMYNSLITALPERIAQYDEVAEIDELEQVAALGRPAPTGRLACMALMRQRLISDRLWGDAAGQSNRFDHTDRTIRRRKRVRWMNGPGA